MQPELPFLETKINPHWKWNGKFTNAALGDPYLHKMFAEAWNERVEACGPPIGNEQRDFGTIDPSVGVGPFGWIAYQNMITHILIYFVKEYSMEEKFKHVKGANIYAKTDEYWPGVDNISTWLDNYRVFPHKKGWRRAYPLIIHSLTDTAGGKSGRARFEASSALTPPDQMNLSGKYFEGGNGTWTLSNDQLNHPTTLQGYGPIQRGDYIGEWILEDIRDALNLLTMTYSFGNGRVITIPPPIDDISGSDPVEVLTHNGTKPSFYFNYFPWAGGYTGAFELGSPAKTLNKMMTFDPAIGDPQPIGGDEMYTSPDRFINDIVKGWVVTDQNKTPFPVYGNIYETLSGAHAPFASNWLSLTDDANHLVGGMNRASAKIHIQGIPLPNINKEIKVYSYYTGTGDGLSQLYKGKWDNPQQANIISGGFLVFRYDQLGTQRFDYHINNEGFCAFDSGVEKDVYISDLDIIIKGSEFISDPIRYSSAPPMPYPPNKDMGTLYCDYWIDNNGNQLLEQPAPDNTFLHSYFTFPVNVYSTLLGKKFCDTQGCFFVPYGWGFYRQKGFAIIRWDVPGGFKYTKHTE